MSFQRKIPPRRDAISTPNSAAATIDEDYLLDLIAANGGTLWQSEIVDALDVSKATVSRRLTALEQSDRIDRLLFRGEKIVSLPGEGIRLTSYSTA